jgi:hypothetical protein
VTVLVLTVDGPGPDIAVDATRLVRVVARAGWRGAEPIDVCAALGVASSASADAGEGRVAVLRAPDGGERALALPARVVLEELAAVWPLPAPFAAFAETRAIVGIALPETGRARVVIAPELLS